MVSSWNRREILVAAVHYCLYPTEIPEINVNNEAITDPRLISENFNSFFTNVGMEIFDSVPPVDRLPHTYQTAQNNVPELDLGGTGPMHVHEIIQTLISKPSTDIDGISVKLLKKISTAISVPLAHIFNLSLENGIFPEALKTSRTVPIFKGGGQSEHGQLSAHIPH